MRSLKRSAALAVAAAGVAFVATPAQGAADTTPPVITSNASAAFVVGSTISESTKPDGGGISFDEYTWNVPELIKWSVTDNSGQICGTSLRQVYREDYPEDTPPLISYPAARRTPFSAQYTGGISDYDGSLGSSGDGSTGWAIKAQDCQGNVTPEKFVNGFPVVLQEDNLYANRDYGVAPGRLSYTGTWGTTTCACASGGAMRNTIAKGASATFTRTYQRDDHSALVMAKGPTRGSATVYVDGVQKATVNTYSATTQNRAVVFDQWFSAGTHTIKVVNLATAGHPRLDLDAVLSN